MLTLLDFSDNGIFYSDGLYQLYVPSLETIILKGNRIWGSLSAYRFHEMKNLKYLDVSTYSPYNDAGSIYGIIPYQLLTQLQYLNVKGNQISGTLDFTQETEGESYLRYLNVYGNRISDTFPTQVVNNAPYLESLILSNNMFTGAINDDICARRNIQNLELDGNMFTGSIPSCLEEMENLQTLTLNDNKMSGQLPNLMDVPLMVLGFDLNEFNPTVPDGSTLPNLVALKLGGSDYITEIPPGLNYPSGLQALSFTGGFSGSFL